MVRNVSNGGEPVAERGRPGEHHAAHETGESSAIRTPTEHPKDPPTTVTGSALESSRLRAAPATCSASAARRSAARLAGPKAFWTGIVV